MTNVEEENFLKVLENVYKNGVERVDRTLIGTKSIFGVDLRFNLENNVFPLLTTRKLALRMIFEELMWILRGETNVRELHKHNVHVWDANATEEFIRGQSITRAFGYFFRRNAGKLFNNGFWIKSLY